MYPKQSWSKELNTDRKLIGNYSDQLLSLVFVFWKLDIWGHRLGLCKFIMGIFVTLQIISRSVHSENNDCSQPVIFFGGKKNKTIPKTRISQSICHNKHENLHLVPPLSSHFIVLKSHCPVTTLHYVSPCLLSINCCAHNGTRISARMMEWNFGVALFAGTETNFKLGVTQKKKW